MSTELTAQLTNNQPLDAGAQSDANDEEKKEVEIHVQLYMYREGPVKLTINPLDTFEKIKDKLQKKIKDKYEDWPEKWKGKPENEKKEKHPTLYWEFNKNTKQILYNNKTLNDYNIGVENITHSHPLQYIEVYSSRHSDFCNICGNEELRLRDKKSNKEITKYLNPYYIDDKLNKCRECALLLNLDINPNEEEEGQTLDQWFLIAMGILLSPAFWVALALPVSSPVLMLMSIIAIIICIIVGASLMFCNYKDSITYNFVIFKDPYHLVPNNYVYYFYGSYLILNILNLIELSRLYFNKEINVVFDCSFSDYVGDEIPKECVVYLELIGSASVVLLATLFINFAVCRRPNPPRTPDAVYCNKKHKLTEFDPPQNTELKCDICRAQSETKGWHCETCKPDIDGKTYSICQNCQEKIVTENKFGVSQYHSLEELKVNYKSWMKENDERMKELGSYYHASIQVIEEVRESEAPAMPVGDAVLCCNDACFCCGPRALIISIIGIVFFFLMTLVSLYTHPSQYIEKLKKDPEHIPSIIISYGIAVWFLCILAMTQYRLTMIFRKAYAMMKIPSNPMNFIQNRQTEEYLDNIGNENNVLDPRSAIITTRFLKAWWDLRQHIEEWELSYFYELTNPIISLEVIFVLAMLVIGLIMAFQDDYDGDLRVFFLNLVV
eukprot:417950_1